MSTHSPRSLSRSKAAAAVLNALISAIGLVVSIAPLHLGAEGASASGDNPPFAVWWWASFSACSGSSAASASGVASAGG